MVGYHDFEGLAALVAFLLTNITIWKVSHGRGVGVRPGGSEAESRNTLLM